MLVDGVDDGQDGDRLPGTPKHKGSLFVNYTRPFMDNLTLDLQYGMTTQSDVLTKVGERHNGHSLGGFTLHNVAATVSDADWEVSIYADNLTDRFAITAVRQDVSFVRDVAGFRLRRYFENVIRPREFGATFRYHFDL